MFEYLVQSEILRCQRRLCVSCGNGFDQLGRDFPPHTLDRGLLAPTLTQHLFQSTDGIAFLRRARMVRRHNRETAICDVFADLIKSGIAQGAFNEVNLHALAYDIVLLGHLPALKSWAMRSRVSNEEWRKEQVALIVSRLAPSSSRERKAA